MGFQNKIKTVYPMKAMNSLANWLNLKIVHLFCFILLCVGNFSSGKLWTYDMYVQVKVVKGYNRET